MLYLTCTMISNVDLAHNRVSHAIDWVTVDYGTKYTLHSHFFALKSDKKIFLRAVVAPANDLFHNRVKVIEFHA